MRHIELIKTTNKFTGSRLMYNVIRIVEKQSMINYGKHIQLNATPMTHKEAVTFLNKMTNHEWCRDLLEQIK